MARGATYGDMLREARTRRGMDLHSVARRLRLRADILASIEDADFASLPPSGYTRNMINSYARLVGLDPREVSERYLDELHLFETGRSRITSDSPSYGGERSARGTSRASQGVRQRSSMVRRSALGTSTYDHYRDRYDQPEEPLQEASVPSYGTRGASSRRGYASSSARDSRYGGYGSYGGSASATGRSDHGYAARGGREVLRAYDSYAFPPADVRAERGMTRGSALPATDYATSPYAGLYSRRDHGQKTGALDVVGGVVSALTQRLPLVIGVVAAIVLLIVIVSFIGGGEAPAPDETPTMPISGLTDTSNQNADAYNMAATESAPTSAKFSFKVASGSRSWMQIEVDGRTVVDETVRGPEEEEYEFTNSVSFRCGNISPVTIMVDGTEVKPTFSSKDEEYTYDVTFASILSEWQRAHPGSTLGSSSSSSSTGSGSSHSSSSSSSTGSGSSHSSSSSSSSSSSNR